MKIVKESARVTLEDNQQLREKIDQLEKEIEITSSKGDPSSGKYFYPLLEKELKTKCEKLKNDPKPENPCLAQIRIGVFRFCTRKNPIFGFGSGSEHFWAFAHNTLPTVEMISAKNARAWVSMVS